jgi:hypothetical protein
MGVTLAQRPAANCSKGTENPIVLGPVETHVFSRGVRPIRGQSIARPERSNQIGLFNLEYLSVEERIPKKGPAAPVGPGEKE